MWNRWFVLVIQWIFTSCSLESTNAWNNSQLPTHIMRYRIGGIDTSSRVLFQDPFKMHDPWILSASISPKVESDAIKARATIRIRQDKENVNPSTSYETKKNDVVSRRNIKGSSSSSKIPASLDIEFLIKRTDQIVAKHDRFASNSSIHILRSVHWLMDAWIQMNGNTDIHRNRNAFSMNSKSLQGRLENYFPDSPSTFVTYQVQRLFDALQEQYNIQPTDKTWTRIIKAHGQERGGEYAMKIVHQMPISQRNVHYYAEVLDSFASEIMMKRSPRRGGDGGILPVSVSPDDSLAKVAQDILQKMIVDDNLPIPNARCFHAVIRAWGHECNPPAAQATLSLMQTLYSQGRIEEAPNRFCFNAIIYAWTNTGYEWHAEMAEELIHEMIQSDTVHPNIVSYNLCISAWAKVGNGERAEGILRKMNTLALKDASFQPSTLTYNTVMNAYSKSPDADAAEKAEKILFEMKKRADKEGIDYQVRPDFFSYSTCINAWARSLDSQKLDRVLNIYEELIQDVNIRPNVVIYNSILNACAYTYGDIDLQRKAMETATTIFRQLDESNDASPDHISYGTFLKVCQNQMIAGETQSQIVRVIFMKCVKDGMVSRFVLDQMKSFPGSWQWIQQQLVLGRETETIAGFNEETTLVNERMDVPPSWKRNVVQGKRKRRRQ